MYANLVELYFLSSLEPESCWVVSPVSRNCNPFKAEHWVCGARLLGIFPGTGVLFATAGKTIEGLQPLSPCPSVGLPV